MNRIQNQINAAKAKIDTQNALHHAKIRQSQREKDGLHRWVTIGKRNNLRLLCKCDKDGSLLSQEKERIKRVKKTLNIKDNE